MEKMNVRCDDTNVEYYYNWIIECAFKQICDTVINSRMEEYYGDDLGKCIYDNIYPYPEIAVRDMMQSNGIISLLRHRFRLMVTFDCIVICIARPNIRNNT